MVSDNMKTDTQPELTPRKVMTLAKKLHSLAQRQELLKMLTAYVDEEELQIQIEKEELEKKKHRIQELLSTINAEGLTIDDLVNGAVEKRSPKTRKPRQKAIPVNPEASPEASVVSDTPPTS